MAFEVRGVRAGRGDPLKTLEQENARLKRIVAEQALHLDAQGLAKGNS
ncbi:hypothetical protein [Nocardioides pelophilus]|nr:hypothetical protein [Nocardioides pelophilus]